MQTSRFTSGAGLSPLRARLFLILLMVLCTVGLSSVAQAQVNRPRSVAVLDFTVPRVENDAVLSREMTDVFALELSRSGNYDVLPRSQVESAISELELTSPLTRSQVQRLGRLLGVDSISIGKLERLERLSNPERLTATVSVLFFDVATGEYINGAREKGNIVLAETEGLDKNELPGVSSSATQQVLADATFNVVQTIENFQLPEATVLITTGNEVWINGGVRNGIQVGQEFIILRGGQRVGRVRVTNVSTQDARAYILDSGRGIRPEDKARAVVDPRLLPSRP